MTSRTFRERFRQPLSQLPGATLGQAGVVLLVLLISAAIGWTASPTLFRYALLAAALLAASIVVLRTPPAGLLLLLVAIFFLPNVPVASLSRLSIAVAFLGFLFFLWLFDMLARRRQIIVHRSRVVLVLLSFALVSVLAFIAGQLPWFPISAARMDAQVGGLSIFLLAACAFLLAAHQIGELAWLKRLVWVFLGLGAFYLVAFLIPGFGRILNSIYQPGARGSIFWTWMATLLCAQALFNNHLPRWQRFGCGAVLVILVYLSLILNREWVSGWLPPVAGLGVMIWFQLRRYRVPLALTAALLLFLFAQSELWGMIIAENQYSLLTRGASFTILLEIIKVNPILGLGPANYYWYTPLYPILGWYTQFNSHNQFVDLIAQTGILGLVLFLWFCLEVLLTAGRILGRQPAGFARAYALAAIGGLAGTLASGFLGDWFLPFVYNIGLSGFSGALFFWLFLGGLVALDQIGKRSEEQAA